jgi:D-alanyl-D-alanine carboxypeptidase (penicillin-binding protein 5/6)
LSWHHVTAQEYFVYDMDRDLFRMRTCEEEDLLYPASITKLFTAYTALQCVPADTQITAGTEIRMIAPLSSVADLQVGDTLTVDQLIGGMLLPSGNDAAYVLAAGIGRILADNPELSNREAVNRFVARMNEEAQKVGMTASHFVTPDGIHDDNHYISVRDFITLGRIAVENEIIAKHASTSKLTVKTAEGRTITWLSSNLMLQIEEWYRCKYAFGLKTGYTTSAGFCLLSYMKVGDRNLLIGVFDCERANARFEDTLLLLVQSFGLAP